MKKVPVNINLPYLDVEEAREKGINISKISGDALKIALEKNSNTVCKTCKKPLQNGDQHIFIDHNNQEIIYCKDCFKKVVPKFIKAKSKVPTKNEIKKNI